MRWILRIFGVLIAAAVVLGAGLLLLPSEKVAQVALEQIRAATGREVTLEGDVDLRYFPVVRVRTGPVTIGNADWSGEGPMVQASALLIGVETWPLLSGQIRIKTIEIDAPSLLLERARDGRVNWEIESGTASSGGRSLAIGLDRLVIRNGKVRYLDHKTGARRGFDTLDATLVAPDLAGRADLEMAFAVTGSGGKTANLTATVDGLTGFLDGVVVPVKADLKAGGGTFGFAGKSNAGGELAGSFSADLPSSAAFTRAVGLPLTEPQKGLGQRIRATGQMVVKGGTSLALRDMDLELDQNRLNINADITLTADRPQVTARIRGGALDFSSLTGGDSGPAVNEWSDAPLDASALSSFNGQARLTAESIDLGSLKLDKSEIGFTLDRSRAVFALSDVAAYGGKLGGEFVINNRSGLSVGGKVSAAGLEARGLLSDTARITQLAGTTTGRVAFLGVGKTMRQIMQSLKGDGTLSVVKGRFEGVDLDRLMNKGAPGGTTVFDSLTAGFDLKDGNLINRDLLLSLPKLEARGEGRIGIGARDIDYLFIPVAKAARKGKDIVVPVRIRGPWDRVRVAPDLAAAAKLNFADEAETAVENAVKKKLGVETQEGQSLEDAVKEKVKKKAEDEIKKGLLKLLE